MSQAVVKHIVEYINNKPNSLIEFPGGDTPLRIFELLIEAANNNEVDLSQASFVSLDEWENLDYETKGSCRQTLFDCLYNQLPIDIDKQVCFFNGKANLEDECRRIDEFVAQRGPIDIAVLGIGMNAHIGFNEPGAPIGYCTIVPLDDVTKEVSVKYFNSQLNIEHGITLGIQHFYEANEVILIANSLKKADIVKTLVEGEITPEVPASLMRNVDNCQFYLDEEAASKLEV